MCFSASASFAASGGLILCGLATRRFRSVAANERPLAAIPYAFGAQQFAEGLVWLGVSGAVPGAVQGAAVYCFSFLAFVFWPFYIPHALACFERSARRRQIVHLRTLGSAMGLYYLWCFTVYSPVTLEVMCEFGACGSLAYQFRLPYLDTTINYVYLTVATVPFFLVTNARVRWFSGLPFLLSFPLTKVFSVPDTFPSTWCFFAAVVSASVFFSLRKQ